LSSISFLISALSRQLVSEEFAIVAKYKYDLRPLFSPIFFSSRFVAGVCVQKMDHRNFGWKRHTT
jgi:hypothetical protein